MRTGVVVVCLAACSAFDPIAEVPGRHREAADSVAAIAAILADHGPARVYAIGEYHLRSGTTATSALARFSREILGVLEPHAGHLVVETWLDACGSASPAPVIAAALGRPAATPMEVMQLVRPDRRRLQTHTLPITCIELDAVIDASGHVDFLLLLELVTDKLAETTRGLAAIARDRAIIVYGGALHNDLHPRWPLAALSYARPLAHELGGGVLEIDLVVPEVVAPLAFVRAEPWFPLLGRASPSRAIVWRRGPASYVVILPAQSEQVAAVAKLSDPM